MILPGRGTAGPNLARASGISTPLARLSFNALPASFRSGEQSAPSTTACTSDGALIRNRLDALATSRIPRSVLSPRVPPASVQNVMLRARMDFIAARSFDLSASLLLCPLPHPAGESTIPLAVRQRRYQSDLSLPPSRLSEIPVI